MSYNDKTISCPQQIVDAFSCLFGESFIKKSDSVISTGAHSNTFNNNVLHVTQVGEDDVYRAIRRLKPTITSGADQIPSFLVKDCGAVLTKPLTLIFNLILHHSVFPDAWKISSIRPVHKKGNTADITNYRPIVSINIFAKVFEILLHTQIYPHVSTYLIPQQHGFLKGRSTVTNLFLKTQ